MAELKPAYLISGEDESKIDAWRNRVRKRVAEDGPEATLEILRDERLTGELVAQEMTALTLSMGRRYVLADGVQGLKAGDVKAIVAALTELPAATVVVLIASGPAPKALAKAVEACGGEVKEFKAPRGDPAWAREHAKKLGIELDGEAADALVARVPRDDKKKRVRQQTLMRELEKLALFAGEGATVDVRTVDLLTASAAETQAYELADAVLEGDRERSLELAENLVGHDVDMMVILFALRRKLRDAQRIWAMLSSGSSIAEVQKELGIHPYAVKLLASKVKNLDSRRFERAFDLLAELDWSVRGGTDRDPESSLTLMLAGAEAG